MTAEATATGSSVAPVWGELRYGRELARLLADSDFRAARRSAEAQPVFLIPGFMAGDASLTVMRQWLLRRGHRTRMSGTLVNVGCAERLVRRMDEQLRAFATDCGAPVIVIGQSRGGALARSLAVRNPQIVSGLVMLGSPVRDGLAVSPSVLRTVRWMALLGDLGMPGVFSSTCKDGRCCSAFREDLRAPLPAETSAISVYSRSDGIVDWRACIDPHVEPVEVDSSHCGMSVNLDVYRVLERSLGHSREVASSRWA
jgi:pimeloyl-ACP methyl ester carboxylesterase